MSAPDGDPIDGQAPGPDNLPVRYEVGYGKPPAEHRFQKGTSGNPEDGQRAQRIIPPG